MRIGRQRPLYTSCRDTGPDQRPWPGNPGQEVTDNRAFGSGTTRTCQAEAIAPDVLARIVRDAIEGRIDRKALRRVLAREKRVRKELVAKLSEDDHRDQAQPDAEHHPAHSATGKHRSTRRCASKVRYITLIGCRGTASRRCQCGWCAGSSSRSKRGGGGSVMATDRKIDPPHFDEHGRFIHPCCICGEEDPVSASVSAC